MTENNFAGPSR